MVVAHECKCKKSACKLASKEAPKLKKLRDSLVPGTVVIILAGRFAGNRAVFLKRLDSGLLLVSGPYKYNGVPLRRIAAPYVIATSTRVDISDVDVSGVDEKMFRKPREAKGKRNAKRFFGRRVGVCISLSQSSACRCQKGGGGEQGRAREGEEQRPKTVHVHGK